MCKCQAELLPRMRVLERSIVCSGSVSFVEAAAQPHRAGLGTVWSLVKAGCLHTMNTSAHERRHWPTSGCDLMLTPGI